MKKYEPLKQRAREWRHQGLALQEICERLTLGKGTVYHWIKDIPLNRKPRSSKDHLEKFRKRRLDHFSSLREQAYAQGRQEYEEHSKDVTFRDFLMLYQTEGSRRERHAVAVCNSNPRLVKLAWYWITKLTSGKIGYWLQYHADQDVESLQKYWSGVLRVPAVDIKVQRKSNSGGLKGRKWRSRWGILTVKANDTYFRERLRAWTDLLEESWNFEV